MVCKIETVSFSINSLLSVAQAPCDVFKSSKFSKCVICTKWVLGVPITPPTTHKI